jgi:hypothetical protein
VACHAVVLVQREDRDAGPWVLTDHLVEASLVVVEEASMIDEGNPGELAGADAVGPTVLGVATV